MVVGLLMTLAAVMALTVNGYAHVRAHTDADDTASRFDIRKVALDRDGQRFIATVRTHDRIRKRHFTPRNAFFIELDTRGGPSADFVLRMDYYEGAYPHCALYDHVGYSRYETDAVKGGRSLSCTLPRTELEQTRHIRWRVVSEFEGRVDRSPNKGWFAH